MPLNRTFFLQQLHASLYPTGLGQSQLEAHTTILDAWEAKMAAADDRWLAYMLGTAFHETGTRMLPVRETYAASDAQAASRLEKAWEKGQLTWVATPYWNKDGDGKYWFGRGLVQITHKVNYQDLGQSIGEDLTTDPSRALDMSVAIKIMFQGMTEGSFTKKYKLSDFFNDRVEDWEGARRIINGTESAALVAGKARSYYAALSYTV